MTSLYRLDTPARQIADAFDADAGKDPWAGGYIAPGRPAPVIINTRDGGRRIVPRMWGVPPPSSFSNVPDPLDYRPVTNVRNLESPFWIGTLRHTEYRCLVPVTSFQTWSSKADPRTGKKRPYWYRVAAEPIFAFAGIWRDSEVASFAFLTTEPNDIIGEVQHGSMPVILRPEDHGVWMRADWNVAQGLAEPYPSKWMESMAG